jgi:hypothetical protein
LHTNLIAFHFYEKYKGGDQARKAVSVTTIRISCAGFRKGAPLDTFFMILLGKLVNVLLIDLTVGTRFFLYLFFCFFLLGTLS